MRVASLTQLEQKVAITLYETGLSARQVAEHFGVKIGAIYYPLRRFNIPRRSATESNQILFEAQPLSFRIKENLSPVEQELKLAAIMLYWAEGYKVGKQRTIDFANSDPVMVLLFKKFLVEICGVDQHKLRCHLYCYAGQNIGKLTRFWSTWLDVPEKQFIKPYINPKIQAGSRGPRMVHGLIHVCYSDKRLLRQILTWITEYSEECVGTQAVNEVWL